jgi:hypothetical protein
VRHNRFKLKILRQKHQKATNEIKVVKKAFVEIRTLSDLVSMLLLEF